ncbi:hypothetical protein BC629DRAFT_1436470 [Irpex lacteus]|nr:hypothetical protein BC629DRAFT_1436470 [Irpex lacteus]
MGHDAQGEAYIIACPAGHAELGRTPEPRRGVGRRRECLSMGHAGHWTASQNQRAPDKFKAIDFVWGTPDTYLPSDSSPTLASRRLWADVQDPARFYLKTTPIYYSLSLSHEIALR